MASRLLASVLTMGPSWLFRFGVARGLPLGLEREPDPPQWVLDHYRKAAPR